MQKGQATVLILVGILVIAVVASGAFYLGRQTTPKLSPTPVASQLSSPTDTSPVPTGTGETANWKTYTNDKNGFSLQYPRDLTVSEENSWITFTNDPHGTTQVKDVSKYVHISLTVKTIQTSTDLKDFIKQDTLRELPSGTKGSIISGSINPYTQSGLSGFSFDATIESVSKHIYLKKDNKVLIFILSGYQSGSNYRESPGEEKILDIMISTLKFQ